MTVQPSDSRPPAPSSPDIAQARLKGMRGKRGFVGDSLHWLGVRLGIAYNGSFYYPSEDRSILECVIIPYYQLSREHQTDRVRGNRLVHARLHADVLAQDLHDCRPESRERARYGAEQHIVDVVGNLERYMAPGSVDVIFLNGVVGWGLN